MKTVKLLIFLLALPICYGYSQLAKGDTVLYLSFDSGNIIETKIRTKGTTRYYHNGIYRKIENIKNNDLLDDGTTKPENHYSFELDSIPYGLYFVDSFLSINKESSDTLRLKLLKKYKVVTIHELKEFLKKNYMERRREEYLTNEELSIEGPSYIDPKGSASFWNRLKHVYMVELDKRNKIAILTEVRLDITIE